MIVLDALSKASLLEVIRAADEYKRSYRAGERSVGLVEPRSALADVIEALSRPAREELTAMMWLGRGDFGGSAQSCLAHARGGSEPNDAQVAYIVAKGVVLADLLRAALAYVEGRRNTREYIMGAMVDWGLVDNEEDANEGIETELDYGTAVALLGEELAAEIWNKRQADLNEPLDVSLPFTGF